MDEMHVKIRGKRRYLWRAVDENGIVLDVFVSERRDKKAATRFFQPLPGSHKRPARITSDRLRSYKSVAKEQTPKTKCRSPGKMDTENERLSRLLLKLSIPAGGLERTGRFQNSLKL